MSYSRLKQHSGKGTPAGPARGPSGSACYEVVGLAYSKAETKGQQRHDVLVHLCCSGSAVLGRVPALLLTKDLSTQNLSARADCYANFS